MWAIGTLPLYKCTERSPSLFWQSHVVRFPCEREKSIEMYHDTKSTRLQSLMVVQHTVSDLQASKRLFHTRHTVVLYSRLLYTYLRNIRFATWFQTIESLFGGNWANGPSVRDKYPCQFSHGRERSISMYGEWWGETCPHWQLCSSLCVSGTMLRQIQGHRRVPRENDECFLSIVRQTNAEQQYH